MIQVIIDEKNDSKVIGATKLKQPTEDDKELLHDSADKLVEKLGDTGKYIKKIIVNFWQIGVWEYLDSKFTVVLKTGKKASFICILAVRNPFVMAEELCREITGFVNDSNLN